MLGRRHTGKSRRYESLDPVLNLPIQCESCCLSIRNRLSFHPLRAQEVCGSLVPLDTTLKKIKAHIKEAEGSDPMCVAVFLVEGARSRVYPWRCRHASRCESHQLTDWLMSACSLAPVLPFSPMAAPARSPRVSFSSLISRVLVLMVHRNRLNDCNPVYNKAKGGGGGCSVM